MEKRKGLFLGLSVLLVTLIFSGCDTANGGDINNTGNNDGEQNGSKGDTVEYSIASTSDWDNAVTRIKNGGNDKKYTLTIQGTVSVPGTTNVKEDDSKTFTFGGATGITVILKGTGTLMLSSTGALVCMWGKTENSNKSGVLIIDGPTLRGKSDNNYCLIRTYYADLELKSGKITGNTNRSFGGGVYIKRGAFTMSGGEISGNSAGQAAYAGDGGGVYIDYSTFTMTGGTISGNIGNNGGGVYVSDYSFTMSGGEIKSNTAKGPSPYGGGIYIGGDGSLKKTGGIIHGYNSTDENSNKVVSNVNIAFPNKGAAVFFAGDIVIGNQDDRYRENTLGDGDNLDTEADTGW
jgi:hypothetical protein